VFDKKIKSTLADLKKNCGAVALKASFEDEGVSDADLDDLILLSGESGLDVYVKIGGCEANRDIEKCLRLGISGIVAPMVETPFAVSKFLDSVQNRSKLLGVPPPDCFINLETIDACTRSKEILDQHHERLSGIVVGRSDLSKSMGLSKKNVNDKEVIEVAKIAFNSAREYGLQTKMGGTVSQESVNVIKHLCANGLLDKFETRAVVFSIKDTENVLKSVKKALEYEQMLLKRRHHFHSVKAGFFLDRVSNIEERK